MGGVHLRPPAGIPPPIPPHPAIPALRRLTCLAEVMSPVSAHHAGMAVILTFYDEVREGAAARVLDDLARDPAASVEVRINSPGGSVTEGLAIFNALKPRKPTVYIDGIAASIASLIAMAGDKIIAAENALIMIHDPWVQTVGNAASLRRNADLLDKHRDAMLGAYLRTGLARGRILELLAAETWLSAGEAQALGFVDEIAEPLRYAAHADSCFASYHNTPKELLIMSTNAGRARAADPAQTPAAADLQTGDENKTLDAFKKGLASDAVTKAAHDAVMAALQERNDQIAAMAQPYVETNAAIRSLMVNALSDPKVTTEQFGQRVLAELARGRGPLNGGGYVATGSQGSSDFIAAASDALAMRAGIRIDKPHPGARDVSGMSLPDIVRACASRSGRSLDLAGQNRGALVQAAMTTSDFPAILGDSLGKALRAGFAAEPATYEAWTRKVLVADFKPQERPVLGSAPGLLHVPEGDEYQYGAIDEDRAVPYSVAKFGRIVKLTWEALINDDLGAFLRMTQALGNAAARAEGDAIYSTFAENAGAGPTMQDGKALFHVDHANLATAAANFDAAALAAARVLLRRQIAIGGGVLNLTPRYLLVSPEHEQAAETLLAAAARGMSQGSGNELVPAWMAKLELVVEARLNDGAFYLLSAGESVDTYERAWLESDNGPVIQEKDGFNTDDKSYKVRHVFGGRWLDWRGAVKVPLS